MELTQPCVSLEANSAIMTISLSSRGAAGRDVLHWYVNFLLAIWQNLTLQCLTLRIYPDYDKWDSAILQFKIYNEWNFAKCLVTLNFTEKTSLRVYWVFEYLEEFEEWNTKNFENLMCWPQAWRMKKKTKANTTYACVIPDYLIFYAAIHTIQWFHYFFLSWTVEVDESIIKILTHCQS